MPYQTLLALLGLGLTIAAASPAQAGDRPALKRLRERQEDWVTVYQYSPGGPPTACAKTPCPPNPAGTTAPQPRAAEPAPPARPFRRLLRRR